ncbi:MAG: diguanylate cyclase, partial [Pseudolabrys sp.]|nr:diguanylate cyclase [Pseudolabrys sp.]
MSRVIFCLTNNHDLRLVALAGLVCLVASFVGINLFLRARAIRGTSRFGWLLTAGGATGCGIWATHFIGLLAYEPGVPLNYDIFLTALSLVFAAVIVTIGFAVAIYVKNPWAPATGGGIVGTGTVVMHYTGMAALHPAGAIIWSSGLVIASIVFSVSLASAAIDVTARVTPRWRAILPAGLLSLSILLLHFTGMGAAGFIPDTSHVTNPAAISSTWLSIAIGGSALIVLTLCLLGAIADRRAQRQIAKQNILLDSAVNNMNQGLCMFDAQHRLLVWNDRYREMYKLPADTVWQGCSMQDLLRARIEAGTFPLEPKRYEIEVKNALKQGKTFKTTIELADGRIISGVNQPIAGGGWVATHEDITDRVRAERELESTRSFLDSIIASVPAPIIVKELPDMRYRLVNKAAEKFFGIPAEGFVGKTTYDVFGRAGDAIVELDRDMLRTGREKHYDEHSFTAPNGETHILTSTRIPIMGPEGGPKYVVTVLHDLTQRKRDEARISHMAHHDTLTDLPNRTAFNECLQAVLSKSKAAGEQFALLSIDLDRFKGVNDLFGQAAGDAVLHKAARRLEEACEGAFLSRLGGDEFAVISPPGPQPATAEALAGRLSSALNDSFDVDGKDIELGATIGVAIYPSDGDDASTLVANADTAQVRAKSARRGSVHFFEQGMDQQLRERRALAHDLHAALDRDELVLNYQPLATVNGDIVGFEALARWHHPQRGLVRPDIFIP